MGSGRYGLKQFPKECLEGPKVVWAMMCLGVLMALRCHLEICQKICSCESNLPFGLGESGQAKLWHEMLKC